MGELAYVRAPEFIISTGDNFYMSAFWRFLQPLLECDRSWL